MPKTRVAKNLISIFCCITAQTVLVYAQEADITAVEQLITSTYQRLERAEELRDLMLRFKEQKARFAEGEQTKAQTAHIIFIARDILKIIEEEHLQYLFSEEHMQELVFLNSILDKTAPKKIVRP